jgi:hypothetical protein
MFRRDFFMPAASAFMAACTGFMYVADAGWALSATIFFITEVALVGGACYFLRLLCRRGGPARARRRTCVTRSAF